MAKINLREYHQEIKKFYTSGQTAEAIAHCKHILKAYPKDVNTYRLLGEAYLESQQFVEAADIFQRVLSVIPDDFISQIGMSIIREAESNLDAAIWHMELAFETQPANAALQDELRRLYNLRDGTTPPKIRLTRGALARTYIQGTLYPQAIAELRAALAYDPNRIDLELLLARTFKKNGQNIEAAAASGKILSKLPYCLEANQILASVLPPNTKSEEISNYQKRIQTINPYLISLTDPTMQEADIPDNSIILDLYEGQDIAAAPQQPAITFTSGGHSQPNEINPAWLAGANETGNIQSNFITEPVIPLSEGTKISAVPDGEIPEWLRSAGWNETKNSQDLETPAAAFEIEQAVEAEIPEWLRSKAPEEKLTEPDLTKLEDAMIRQSGSAPVDVDISDLATPASQEIPSVSSFLPDTGERIDNEAETRMPENEERNTIDFLAAIDSSQSNFLDVGLATPGSTGTIPILEEEQIGLTQRGQTELLNENEQANLSLQPEPVLLDKEFLSQQAIEPEIDTTIPGMEAQTGTETIEAPQPGSTTEAIKDNFIIEEPPQVYPTMPTAIEEYDTEMVGKAVHPGTEAETVTQSPSAPDNISEWLNRQDLTNPAGVEQLAETNSIETSTGFAHGEQTTNYEPDGTSNLVFGESIQSKDHQETTEKIEIAPAPSNEYPSLEEPQEVDDFSEVKKDDNLEVVSNKGLLAETSVKLPETSELENARKELSMGNLTSALMTYNGYVEERKQLDTVIHDLLDTIIQFPINVGLWQTLGDAYAADNRFREAMEAYTKAENLIR